MRFFNKNVKTEWTNKLGINISKTLKIQHYINTTHWELVLSTTIWELHEKLLIKLKLNLH